MNEQSSPQIPLNDILKPYQNSTGQTLDVAEDYFNPDTPWWLEEQTVSAANGGGSAYADALVHEAALLQAAPLAGTVLNMTEGLRNGYLGFHDVNGTVLNLSDAVTPPEQPLHTLQKSTIQGHATAGDEINISSRHHHAVFESLIITGGGDNKVAIEITIPWGERPPFDDFEVFAREDGFGFGMVNSSLVAGDAESVTITMKSYVGCVYGAHSPGATSIVGSRGNDSITLDGWYYCMVNASLHAGEGNDSVEVDSLYGTMIRSAVHLGEGDDTLEVYGWGAGGKTDPGAVFDSIIMTGTGNDSVLVTDADRLPRRDYSYMVEESTFLLGQGNDTVNIYCWSGGALGHSAVFLEDYTEDAGDKTFLMSATNDYFPVEDHIGLMHDSEINLGNGNDSIEIVHDSSTATVVTDSYILTADGNDTLRIEGYESKGAALDNVFVDMGGDNDLAVLENGILNSDVFMGTGNDTVDLSGKVLASKVMLGTGNDVLRLTGEADLSGSTLDGGGNNTLNYAGGKVGDILSLDEGYFDYLTSGAVATVRNFESLHLDFKDGTRHSLDLDELLGGMGDGALRNCRLTSLVLTGDGGEGRIYDNIYMGEDATLRASNISVEGMEGQFDWYTANAGTVDQMEVYIATGMLIV